MIDDPAPLGGGCDLPRGINLADDQLEKLFSLKKEMITRCAPKMTDLKLQEMDLLDLISQPQVDKGKVQAAQNKINGLKADLANLRVNFMVDSLSVLSDDQRKDLRRTFIKGQTMPKRGLRGGGKRLHGHGGRSGGFGGPGGPGGPGGFGGPGGPGR